MRRTLQSLTRLPSLPGSKRAAAADAPTWQTQDSPCRGVQLPPYLVVPSVLEAGLNAVDLRVLAGVRGRNRLHRVVEQSHAMAAATGVGGGFDAKADAAAQGVLLQAAGVDGGGEDVRGGGVDDGEVAYVAVCRHLMGCAVVPFHGVDLAHLPWVAHCMHTAHSSPLIGCLSTVSFQ